jgi:predicted acyltransferase
MLAMASAGLNLAKVAKDSFPHSDVWGFLAYQTDHVAWLGCGFWDLIQPSFMFMVGVAMPYSFASRASKGASRRDNAVHVAFRAVLLIVLGVFLSSNGARQTNYTFVNVLTQIGLGYAFVYLLLGRGWRVQLAAAAAILVGYWLLFALYPVPGADFDYSTVGVKDPKIVMSGLFAHWNMNVNAAARFDEWFLNLLPREKPFAFNEGGYQTLNFVPSMATMIFGLMAGEWLRGRRTIHEKFAYLVIAGALCLGVGWLLDQTVCPSVKRIWTPSWAVFSTGWTLLMLAGFFWVIDVRGWRGWSLPLVVVGMNSIAMYCMAQLMKGWVRGTLKTNFGQDIFAGTYGPIFDAAAVLFVLWLACLWMYRKKVFVRI